MRLLVTRPDEDARITAAALQARGHQAVLCPLLHIRLKPEVLSLDVDTQAILITSANGVRALATAIRKRDVPVLAVGPSSAQAAAAAGFSCVQSANGDVAALAELAQQKCDPSAGPLLHVAGNVQAGDLQGLLQQAGFTVDRQVLYEAVAAEGLPVDVTSRLDADQMDGVLLYSPRTAAIWSALVTAAGLAGKVRTLAHLCISRATADALDLDGAAPDPVLIAAQPNGDAMLALVDQLVASQKQGQNQEKGQR